MIRPKPPTIYRPWTIQEDNKLFQMKRDGRSRLQISLALHRSPEAIKSRLRNRYRYRPARTEPKPAPVIHRSVILISHADVETWYLLGWRMIAINGNKITAQWQSEREPRWPDDYLAEAA